MLQRKSKIPESRNYPNARCNYTVKMTVRCSKWEWNLAYLHTKTLSLRSNQWYDPTSCFCIARRGCWLSKETVEFMKKYQVKSNNYTYYDTCTFVYGRHGCREGNKLFVGDGWKRKHRKGNDPVQSFPSPSFPRSKRSMRGCAYIFHFYSKVKDLVDLWLPFRIEVTHAQDS